MPTDSVPQPHALERWLRTPWRRLALVALAVLLLAGTSTLLWADAAAAVGREIDPWWTFRRRLIIWGIWGLLFEPLLHLSALLARWLRPLVLVLLVHGGLSVVLAVGVHHLDLVLARAWLQPDRRDRTEEDRRDDRRDDRRRGDDRDRFDRDRDDRPRRNEADRPPSRSERRREFWQRVGRNRRAETGIVVYWLIVGLGLAVRSYVQHRDQERRAASLELRTARLEGELSSAQLSQLEAQLHPHFLFNALHSVGGLVREDRREEALETLGALGGLLRATLRHGERETVPLSEELDLVEHYLDVERIRLGDRLDVQIETEPGTGRIEVPPLLLLPLVENSIKYAVAPRSEGGRLRLAARRVGSTLVLEVEDDGLGFPPEVLAGSEGAGGVGLANTRSRLEALHGPESLRLENLPGGGARITLRLPADD